MTKFWTTGYVHKKCAQFWSDDSKDKAYALYFLCNSVLLLKDEHNSEAKAAILNHEMKTTC